MFLYKFWKWQPGISKAERWNVTAVWKTFPLFLACFHLYPGWSWGFVGSGRTGKISHQIFPSLPFPSSFFVPPFIFFCSFPFSPILTRSEEWHLKHLVKNMSCIPKRYHMQPSAPSEEAPLAWMGGSELVCGSSQWLSLGALSLAKGSAAAFPSVPPLPAPGRRDVFHCVVPFFTGQGVHGRDETFFPSALFLAAPLIAGYSGYFVWLVHYCLELHLQI